MSVSGSKTVWGTNALFVSGGSCCVLFLYGRRDANRGKPENEENCLGEWEAIFLWMYPGVMKKKKERKGTMHVYLYAPTRHKPLFPCSVQTTPRYLVLLPFNVKALIPDPHS